MAIAIINGKRILVPDSGVAGEELLKAANLLPGRRGVIQSGIESKTIEPRKRYTKEDLVDKKGNPVRIRTMPDRTKGGTPTFGTSRSLFSKRIITEQVIDIASKLFKRGVSFDEQNANWMVVDHYILPPRWHSIAKVTPLMIVFPTEYPALPPVGFYLKDTLPVSANGHLYTAAYHSAWKKPLEEGWKWYCVYVNEGSWRPAPVREAGDWNRGDNIWTYFTLINEALSGDD